MTANRVRQREIGIDWYHAFLKFSTTRSVKFAFEDAVGLFSEQNTNEGHKQQNPYCYYNNNYDLCVTP